MRLETNRSRIVARLEREGWEHRGGNGHDKYRHPGKPGIVIVPRHRELSIGVARDIAETAGWLEKP
jgi:predicted RNA binding protein YcfA (HicA-like mRNA interferase family)